MRFAIVDFETTGQVNKAIIEIGVVILEGDRIVDEYSTLINPERRISTQVTELTGICNSMVADAPKIYQVLDQLMDLTRDCIFVAHNVDSDYPLLQGEFEKVGKPPFLRKTLCTLELSRKLLMLKSYQLEEVCHYYHIKMTERHRALHDAKVTAALLLRLLEHFPRGLPPWIIIEERKEDLLPLTIKRECVEALPHTAGIFFLTNASEIVLYVGVGADLHASVKEYFRNHLEGGGPLAPHLRKTIVGFSYRECGSYLYALLLQRYYIKVLAPLLNSIKEPPLEQQQQHSLPQSYPDKHFAILCPQNNFILIRDEKLCGIGSLPRDRPPSMNTLEKRCKRIPEDQLTKKMILNFLKNQHRRENRDFTVLLLS